MCWSEGASAAMFGLGTVAAAITLRRGEPLAIPATLAYFALMEALQVGGNRVIDQCDLGANQTITALSYLHIALQPLFINAFAMAIAPRPVSPGTRRLVYALAGIATVLLILRLVPFGWAGPCRPGDPLCGAALCTTSGTWHLAWDVPLRDLWFWAPDIIRDYVPFPEYMLAVFALPLFYGAWRLVIFHAMLGPILARVLTDNPNEMPAIWCLFSVGLVILGLSPLIRTRLLAAPARRPGVRGRALRRR
jgi:hypothetical protein